MKLGPFHLNNQNKKERKKEKYLPSPSGFDDNSKSSHEMNLLMSVWASMPQIFPQRWESWSSSPQIYAWCGNKFAVQWNLMLIVMSLESPSDSSTRGGSKTTSCGSENPLVKNSIFSIWVLMFVMLNSLL